MGVVPPVDPPPPQEIIPMASTHTIMRIALARCLRPPKQSPASTQAKRNGIVKGSLRSAEADNAGTVKVTFVELAELPLRLNVLGLTEQVAADESGVQVRLTV